MFVRVLDRDELWVGEMIGVDVGGLAVLLIAVDDGQLFAYEDRCAHQQVKLSTGKLDGCVLTCSAHEWQYDACTGHGLNPDSVRLRAIPVRVRGGEIEVDVEAAR
jgi:toluene monooxygenase system ferredoxin subunit